MNSLNQKACEIGRSVFGISRSIKSSALRRRMEERVLKLLEETAYLAYRSVLRSALIIESLVHVGVSADQIDIKDSKSILKELQDIRLLIGKNCDPTDGENARITGVIAESSEVARDTGEISPSEPQSLDDIIKVAQSRSLISGIGGVSNRFGNDLPNRDIPAKDSALMPQVGNAISKTDDESRSNILSSGQANRQSAIYEKMKNDGNCRMKDFMGAFPDISERTIRNDLQKLLDQGLIRRVGNGGPYTFYTAKL